MPRHAEVNPGPAVVLGDAPRTGKASPLVIIEQETIQPDRPLIHDALVVYLGAGNVAIPLPGAVIRERIEVEPGKFETVRTVSDSGFSNYVFEQHDLRGRLNKLVLLKASDVPENMHHLIGRVSTTCEHPEHLRLFMRHKGKDGSHDFRVLVPANRQTEFRNFVAWREKQIRSHEAAVKETSGDAEG